MPTFACSLRPDLERAQARVLAQQGLNVGPVRIERAASAATAGLPHDPPGILAQVLAHYVVGDSSYSRIARIESPRRVTRLLLLPFTHASARSRPP